MLVRFIVDTYTAAGEATLAALVANDFSRSAYNPLTLGLEFRTRNDTYESVALAFALQGRWSDAETWLAACRRVATFDRPDCGTLTVMSRKFTTVDYEATLDQTMSLREALPASHLARFVVDLVAQLDLSLIYAGYADRGGIAYAPEILLALLFYGYATGVFSSRRIEKATYEMLPFRFIAGGLHPDHDTMANFRKTFLSVIKDLFVQMLLLAQAAGYLKLGNISLDGSKIHANASKSHAVSYKRLVELEVQLRPEVDELFRLAEQVDQASAGWSGHRRRDRHPPGAVGPSGGSQSRPGSARRGALRG